jgi:hypothetical protein
LGKCVHCGGKARWPADICGSCYEKRKANERLQEQLMAEKARHEQELVAAEIAESNRRRLAEIAESNRRMVDRLIEQAKSGATFYLHESVYLPVDSVVTEQELAESFDIGPLRSLGFEGWRIVGVVPKTLGIGLKNKSIGSEYGTTWGAGLGGNVAGAYVLLELEVNSLRAESLRSAIQAHVERGMLGEMNAAAPESGFPVDQQIPPIIGLPKQEDLLEDDMYIDAIKISVSEGKASTFLLQRKLGIDYGRAAKLINMMEMNQIVGPADGAKPRELLVGLSFLDHLP